MHKGLGSAVALAQLLIADSVKRGGIVVDATAGNGADTLFLAQLVGPEGTVYAFDIQEKALRATRALLEKTGVADRVVLIRAGHEKIENFVTGSLDAVMFNLGYLPGGDHSIMTCANTTIVALNAALNLLRPGGRVGLVIYTGHPGGGEEYTAVEEMVASLDRTCFVALRINFLNRAAHAPVMIIVEKAGA